MKIRIKHPIYGVPISFINKYNSDQFEIITLAAGNSWANFTDTLKLLDFDPDIRYKTQGGLGVPILNGKGTYGRIIIKQK